MSRTNEPYIAPSVPPKAISPVDDPISYEYKTVTDASAAKLDKEVNVLLMQGWYLYGAPYSIVGRQVNQFSEPRYCQAMKRDIIINWKVVGNDK